MQEKYVTWGLLAIIAVLLYQEKACACGGAANRPPCSPTNPMAATNLAAPPWIQAVGDPQAYGLFSAFQS